MRKILTALVAAATISATAIATSNSNAWWGWWFPGAVAAGVVTGAVLAVHWHHGRTITRMVTTLTDRTLITVPLRQGLERLQLGTRLLVTNWVVVVNPVPSPTG